MRKSLAISLAALLVLVGAQAAFAMGAMAVKPPAHAAMVMTDMTATCDHCAGQPDNCYDIEICAFFCVSATIADTGGRCSHAWHSLPAKHLRWAAALLSDHNRSPPAPPPRLLSLV